MEKKLYIWCMRKYQETTDYWVYAHTTPNGLYYIGMSKLQPCRRWRKSAYKGLSIEPYIIEYGWENIAHKVIVDGLTKEQAEAWEDQIIQALSMNGLCINKQRSGGICNDIKIYQKQYYKEHNKEKKEHNKQWRKCNKLYYKKIECKIYQRVANYNRNHVPIETPMEAKQKYLQCGYIPAYIKNDDL